MQLQLYISVNNAAKNKSCIISTKQKVERTNVIIEFLVNANHVPYMISEKHRLRVTLDGLYNKHDYINEPRS